MALKETTSQGRRTAGWTLSLVAALVLAACGGGGGSSGSGEGAGNAGVGVGGNDAVAATVKPTEVEAARFLTQATMGATEADIKQLSSTSYGEWFNAQMAKPQQLHRTYVVNRGADRSANGQSPSQNDFFESFWKQAVTSEDQLRQRAAFALSEILVISFADANLGGQYRGVSSYYDMLGEKAFGNYRDLLENVSLHPMMGIYLSHRGNQKEDAATGRVPDENYAREIMQLFSIGLYQLNPDGTVKKDGAGVPLETYTADDIAGLAKVFTGWGYYAGVNPADRTDARFFGNNRVDGWDWRPMQAYNKFHSTSAKSFLGVTIPAQSAPNAEADLKIALDTIFNHPNVGPYIGKNLIQRLVTSNPSPAYVERVARVFNDNGAGVRGDMKAVFKAILMDNEARLVQADNTYGKLREPVLRYSHFLRAFKAKSTQGAENFTGINNTEEPSNNLGQAPLRSPTVFNFFRIGYTPPNTTLAAANKVAPEMQTVHEVTVAGYSNYMRDRIRFDTNRDVQPDYSAELAVADNAGALADRMKLILFAGQMPDTLRNQMIAAINGRAIPAAVRNAAGAVTNQTNIDSAKLDRVYIAVFLSVTAPDYLVQK